MNLELYTSIFKSGGFKYWRSDNGDWVEFLMIGESAIKQPWFKKLCDFHTDVYYQINSYISINCDVSILINKLHDEITISVFNKSTLISEKGLSEIFSILYRDSKIDKILEN